MTEPAAEPGQPSPPPEPPLSIDAHGIGWLSLPPAEHPEGAGAALWDWLEGALDRVEPPLAEGLVRALVVQGAEPGAYVRDEPLGEPDSPADAEQAAGAVRRAQRVLRRLELLPVPTVAAVDGACLGTGAALALACAYRVASDRPATRIGFPAVRLGLVPGPGSSVRLPRLVGLRTALELVLGGRSVPAREARRIRLVDEVYPPRDFRERVRGFVLERLERGRRRAPFRRIARRLLEDTAPGRRMVLARVERDLMPRLAFAAPAPERALELIREGPLLPLDEAFRREAEVLGALAVGERSRALRYASRAARSAARAAPAAADPVERVGVLGAGATGGDLAYLLASAGIPARLKEVSREALGEGIRRALRHLALDVAAGRISEAEADRSAERIEGSLGYGGFGTLDLAVIAVGDEPDAVRSALRQAGDHTREGCVLAFASPVLGLATVREGLERPERVACLRTCPPADRFPVVEVVADDEAAAAACVELLQRMGRTTLRVADCPGGVSNRLLAVLLAEATRVVEDGTPAPLVDRALEEFGFVQGPFRRIDAVGVPRSQRLLLALAAELGDRFRPAPPLERVSAGGGEFYAGREGGSDAAAAPPGGWQEEAERIRNRLLLLLVNEAARILEEGVVATPAEVEVAALLGLGFPRARGGLLYHADRLGASRLVDLLQEHEERLGERFSPAPLLAELRGRPAGLSGHAPAGVL